MRIAVINGPLEAGAVIENIIEAGEGFELPGKALIEADNAGIGWAWDGEAFSPPAPQPAPIPATCTPAQAKIVLWEYGLLDDVEATIEAHPYRPVAIWYTSATVWERSHPYLNALAVEIDLTDEQVDEMFVAAQLK